jgi:thiol-disulfide isomerase/thioredoxin
MDNNKIVFGIFLVFLMILGGCTYNAPYDTPKDIGMNSSLGNNSNNEIDKNKLVVYFFWGDGCPHCENQKPFLERMANKYPDVQVRMFETWSNKDNQNLFSEIAKAYDTQARGVPATFIGDKFWVGFRSSMETEMEDKIKSCLENECITPYLN